MTKVWDSGAEVFEVGTRVRYTENGAVLKKGDLGTVMERSILPFVQWDKEHVEFHNGNGQWPEGRIFAVWTDELEEVTE